MSGSRSNAGIGCVPLLLVGFGGLLVFLLLSAPDYSRAVPWLFTRAEPPEPPPAERSPKTGEIGALGTVPDGRSVWLCLDYSATPNVDQAGLDALDRKPRAYVVLQRLEDAGRIKAYPVGTRVLVMGWLDDGWRKVKVLEGKGVEGWVHEFEIFPPSYVSTAPFPSGWTTAFACLILLGCAIFAFIAFFVFIYNGGIAVIVGTTKRHSPSVKPKPDYSEL